MTQEVEITAKGYAITLENRSSGATAIITLSPSRERWIVKTDGFRGYYSSLETATSEVLKLIKTKL